MDLKIIKDLISILDKNGLSKLQVREKNGFEVTLEKNQHHSCSHSHGSKGQFHHAPPQEFLPVAESAQKASGEKEKGHFIKSPMVGTFYASPSPNDPPFAKVGERIEKGAVICIIEAMKVMNEVKADKAGVIKEILMENMQPVEFGTKLFRIE
ncbi:MAG: acetyl-CoA carboxylase biotin carboxyl carrier protein [Rhabdochlamydiaceae bacterium]|nr:acetyl-CoA carboxylase biotin carboxyl carrier protein [Candidatus Amphrikana amoebophyrae]